MKHSVLTLGILGLCACASNGGDPNKRVGEVHPDLAASSDLSASEEAGEPESPAEPLASEPGPAELGSTPDVAPAEPAPAPRPEPSAEAKGQARAQVAAATQDRPYTMDSSGLLLWTDPRFQRELAESYKAVTDVEPPVTLEELEDLQKIFEWLGDDTKTEKAMNRLQDRREGRSAVYDFTIGNLYFQDGDLEQARAAYEKAIEKHKNFLRAHKNLGIIHVQNSEMERAAQHLTQVVELGGGEALVYGLLGYAYSGLEQPMSAETAYRMAVLLDPLTADWKMGLARSLFKQQRFPEAIALTGSMIEGKPDDVNLWLLQANAFIGQGMSLRAAENYEMVDRLGGSTPATLNMLGDIYTNEALYDSAADAYVRSLVLDPDVDTAKGVRNAQVLTFRGAHADAQRLIDEIERLQGERLTETDRKDLLKLEARIAVADGAGEEEVRILEEIVALDPLDGEALLLLGQNASRNGDDELADNYYQRAEQLEKHAPDAKVRRAQLCVKQGNYAEAVRLLKAAQSLQPRENIQQYLEQVEKVSRAR